MSIPAVESARGTPTLVRQLGLWSSIGIVIGITIGGGIFRTPAGIAARVPDPPLMLASLERHLRFVAKAELFRIPVFGSALRASVQRPA